MLYFISVDSACGFIECVDRAMFHHILIVFFQILRMINEEKIANLTIKLLPEKC
jgi:hypothetical protein